MKSFLILLLLAGLTPLGLAQVAVSLKMDRRQYLVHEPVTAVVTITNRSGRELTYTSRMKGQIAHSWLRFSMRDSNGRSVAKLHHKVFQRAVIPAGRSMSRRVSLSSMFGLSQMGNYSVTAQVSQPGVDDTAYGSNSGQFTVGGGSVLQTLPFGVSGKVAPKREYRVVSFNDGRQTSIYTQVMNTISDRALATLRLSKFLTFEKPQIALDGKNQLHVLYLASPEVFVEATINEDGRHVSTEYFKRASGRKPHFVPFTDGTLVVSGGIPFDPLKEAEDNGRARRASERPE